MRISKLNLYIFVSIVTTAIFASQTARDHSHQAFPTVVALAHSRSFSVIFTNFLIALNCLGGKLLIKAFFGRVQAQETQRISDRLLGMIFESCLTLTFFHSSLTPVVACVCIGQFLIKLLIHLCSARQQLIEQSVMPATRPSTVRLSMLLGLIFFISVLSVNFFVMQNNTESAHSSSSVTIALLFACDAAVCAVQVFSVSVKVLLNELERVQGRVWEAKGLVRFYVEILADVTIAIIGIFFVVRVWVKVSAPYFLGRQLFVNVRNVFKGISDVTQYMQLMKKIDRQVPNATPEEVERSEDKHCNICYDDLSFAPGAAVVKRLPCGHFFHRQCLLRWLERNASCPYCKTDIAAAAAPPPAAAAAAPARQAQVEFQFRFRAQDNNDAAAGNALAAILAQQLRERHQREQQQQAREQQQQHQQLQAAVHADQRMLDDMLNDADRLMYEFYRKAHKERTAEKVRGSLKAARDRGFGEAGAAAAAPPAPAAASGSSSPTSPRAAGATTTSTASPAASAPAAASDATPTRVAHTENAFTAAGTSTVPAANDAVPSSASAPAAAATAGRARDSVLLRRLAALGGTAIPTPGDTDDSPAAAAPLAPAETSPRAPLVGTLTAPTAGSNSASEQQELAAYREFAEDLRRALARLDAARNR